MKLAGTPALFLGVVLLLFPTLARCQQAAIPKRILVLYWDNKDFPSNISFDRSFQQGLQSASAGSLECYSEYLESDRFPEENQALVLRDYLIQKYARRHIDVVVAVSDVARDFLLKYRSVLFTDAPIVFVGVFRPKPEEIAAGAGMTGIFGRNEYKKTIDLALRLHPGTELVTVISSTPQKDKMFEIQCRDALQGYESGVSISYLTDLPPAELIDKAGSLPPGSIILYVYQQAKDDTGRILDTYGALDLIVRSARVPIYGLASWKIGRGIVGGYVRMNDENGARAAALALQIASGTPARDIPIELTPVVPVFDWRVLKRWGIDEASLPPGSIVQFRAASFWAQYKWYAVAATTVFALQFALIAGLVISHRRRKRAEAERERAWSEVADSRARLAGVVGSAMDAIVSVDENERIVLFNDAARKMFCCAEHEAIGQPLEGFIPDRFREAHQHHIRAFGESNTTKKSIGASRCLYGRRANGEEFPIESSVSKLELNGRKFYTVILRDITERKQSEEALRDSEARIRNMADTVPAMIWMSNPDKQCTYVNQRWLDFTGKTLEQVLGLGWAESVHPEDVDRGLETFESAFGRREPFEGEYRLRRADGEFRWVHDRGTPVFSSTGEFAGFLGACIDVTERKLHEETQRGLLQELDQLKNQLEAVNIYLQEEIKQDHNFNEIVGNSAAIRSVLSKVEKVAPVNTTVLVTGETGTGKELVARAIHSASSRSHRPFVKVNCAALPATLIESELFGYERGAFTGAEARKQGRFEIANGATIFLDEIGELPLESQGKLLRVIQEGEFERLGGVTTLKTDARIIAATNRDLKAEVERRAFRSDLWYRLNVYPIRVPPLRERREDIPLLVSHFAKRSSDGLGKPIDSLPLAAMKAMENYAWPGNVRELANVIERAVISSTGSSLLLAEPLGASTAAGQAAVSKTLEEIERDYIVRVLVETGGKIEGQHGAALLLGLHPSTLRTRMAKLGIRREEVGKGL